MRVTSKAEFREHGIKKTKDIYICAENEYLLCAFFTNFPSHEECP